MSSKDPITFPREGRTYAQVMAFARQNCPGFTDLLLGRASFDVHFSKETLPKLKVYAMEESRAMVRRIAGEYLGGIYRAEEDAEHLARMTPHERTRVRKERRLARRRSFYAPGNVVKTSFGYDLVLAYEEGEDYRWTVLVVAVAPKMGGGWMRCGRVRTHQTEPDRWVRVEAQGVQGSV